MIQGESDQNYIYIVCRLCEDVNDIQLSDVNLVESLGPFLVIWEKVRNELWIPFPQNPSKFHRMIRKRSLCG